MAIQQGTKKPTDTSTWPYRLRLMGALLIPTFIETLDYTVVATAQTSIASTFQRLDLQSYIGTAYVLTSTVFLPLFASIADIFGRHWAMQISLLFFLLGSAISTGSNDMITMLVGRGIAGIGAAGLLTVVRIILSDSSSLDDNNFQAAMLVVLYAVGYSVGPILGGVLTSISYRWVFGINLPFGVLSMVLIFFLLRNRIKGPQPRRVVVDPDPTNPGKETITEKILRIDFVGASLFIAGGILLLLALNWGSTVNWSDARVIVCFIIGGLLILAFVGWEYVVEPSDDHLHRAHSYAPNWTHGMDAMIPLGVFKNYDVCATCFAAMTSGMVMLGIFYFVAIFYVVVSGISARSAGVQLVFFAPGIGAGVLVGIALIKHLRQPRYPIILSTILITVALGLIAKAMQDDNQPQINGFMIMCGAGVGMGFGPLAIHSRFSQPENRIAVVTALNLFFRTAGGTLGLAQLYAVMNSQLRSYITDLFTSGTLSPSDAVILGEALKGGIDSLDKINSLPDPLAGYIKEAFRFGVKWAFISLIPWCGVSVIAVLFLSNIPDTDLDRGRKAVDQEKLTTSHREEAVEERGTRTQEDLESQAAAGPANK